MTELERFFRRLVNNLAAIDPSRLRGPVPLADIPTTIVPYRSNRRALHVDTSEEYEMVLLRLCAGEGGYVVTEPEEVRLKFEEEAQSANPDLEVIHRFEDITLWLRPERLAQTLEPPLETPQEEIEVPSFVETAVQAEPEPEPGNEVAVDEDEAIAEESSGSQCVYCGGTLPDRPLNFCPHCGQSQVTLVCPKCRADVEPGWKHCVNCGLSLGGR